ncbi:MAG: RNA methyltransferase, partial [Pseudoxanthomonas sp.]
MNIPAESPESLPETAASRIRIVLVGTQHPGNIGAAARALKTMGLSKLVLVAPEQYPADEAFRRAAGADDLLASARVVATLAEAVADCRFVLGCTARSRRVALEEFHPHAAGERVAAIARRDETALVFGRERTGLTNEELQLCHASVHIPANPEYSSLNLAAAVQVLA